MGSEANLIILTFDVDTEVTILLFSVLLSFERNNKVFKGFKTQTKGKFKS